MVRAGDAVAGHLAAVADVGAEVRAVGLHDVQAAVLAPVGRQVLAEVAQGHGLVRREVRRPADLEPAGRPPGVRDLHRRPARQLRPRPSPAGPRRRAGRGRGPAPGAGRGCARRRCCAGSRRCRRRSTTPARTPWPWRTRRRRGRRRRRAVPSGAEDVDAEAGGQLHDPGLGELADAGDAPGRRPAAASALPRWAFHCPSLRVGVEPGELLAEQGVVGAAAAPRASSTTSS